MIIADCGSGNSCRNDINIARQMVFELAKLKIPGLVIKWQLFKQAGENVPLHHEIFDSAYHYAMTNFGIETTASVFDKESLDFLLTYRIPFIKIANNKQSASVLNYIPEARTIIISKDNCEEPVFNSRVEFKENKQDVKYLYCISKYPATMKEYEAKFGDKLREGISDHTTNFDMFNKYQPKVYEFHFKLEDTIGLDAGEFARTPAQIKEWLKPKPIDLEEVLRTPQ
jgi:sialic acid synthase SpsE